MVSKKYLKNRDAFKLTFEVEGLEAETLALIAEFTSWQEVPFERTPGGVWKLTVEVPANHKYEFRYKAKQGDRVFYLSDDTADDLVPNIHGSENAVVFCILD